MTAIQEKLPDTAKPQPQNPACAASPHGGGPEINPYADPHDALIAEYRASLQFSNDPLGAIIASETVKLFAFGARYQALLDAGLEQATTLADLKNIDFAIKRRLDMHRQCQMYGQLSVKIDHTERRAEGRHIG